MANGCWWSFPTDWCTTYPCSFQLRSSKLKMSETDILTLWLPTLMTTHNDQISNLEHVLDPLFGFFSPRLATGCWGWGSFQGTGVCPAHAVVSLKS